MTGWLAGPVSATAARRRELEVLVAGVFDDSDGTYGYRRVHQELVRGQVVCSPELVRQVMRKLGLYPCQPKPFRPTTTTPGDAVAVPDLVKRDFTADAPGTKLVRDITYIATQEGFAYLTTVIYCHTKGCIGWAVADHMASARGAERDATCLKQPSDRCVRSPSRLPAPAAHRSKRLVHEVWPSRFTDLPMRALLSWHYVTFLRSWLVTAVRLPVCTVTFASGAVRVRSRKCGPRERSRRRVTCPG
jgi:transposase InsO family protein